MSKSYLERTTRRKRRNKKTYWTPSFMALPSMAQSHIKRYIICDDEMFEIHYVVIKRLKWKMCWTPSFNVLPLQTISTFVVSRNYVPRRFLFVWDSTTILEVANKYIALILGKPSITSMQIWSAKALGGALQIFNSPFGKVISAKGGLDRVRTSYNCFDW